MRKLSIGSVVGAFAVLAVIGSAHVLAGPSPNAKFIGIKKCKTCHFKQYKTWKKMSHANAWKIVPDKYKTDKKCVACHTTGAGRPGGFVDEASTSAMTAVQCEACHGPGSEHAQAANDEADEKEIKSKINKVPANTCVACHNPHKSHDEYKE